MTLDEFTVDKLNAKEVQIQDSHQDHKFNLYLYIIQNIKTQKPLTKIREECGLSKTAFQYHLNKLKSAGAIAKIGYGVWEVTDDTILELKRSTKTTQVTLDKIPENLNFLRGKEVRGHAFVFTVWVPQNLRNWTNEKREQYLRKHEIEFFRLKIAGGGQRIVFRGKKIWLTNKSVILYDRDSYFSTLSAHAKSHAIVKLISHVKGLECLLHADFTERAGRQYRFKVSRQHYALVQNALAQQYDAEGKKLEVYADRGRWFLIDNSFNLHEAETVHPESADEDNVKVQNFFNSLKEHPLTTDFILEGMNGIQRNQLMFAENIKTHITAIKDLSDAVNEFRAEMKKLKRRKYRMV